MTTWVFGYGSLVWRPGFAFEERCVVAAADWARRFWQGSPDHRGTPELPGRVATLLRWPGVTTRGMAYRLGADSDAIVAALDRREVAGYQRVVLPVQSDTGETFDAVTWVATTANPNFLGMARPPEMAATIHRAVGASGPNREYVLRLAQALREIDERADDQTFELERLLLELQD